MGKRLFRWILFSFIGALLPLLASLYIHQRSGKSYFEAWTNSPEILFFGIMVSASALGDLFEKSPLRWSTFMGSLGIILVFGIIVLAFQYGNFLHSLVTDPQALYYRSSLLEDSWYPVMAVALLSTVIEILIGWLED